jgi:TolA-binding protein
MVRKQQRPSSLSNLVKEEVRERDTESLSPTTSPEKSAIPPTEGTTPVVKSSQNTAKTTSKEPEKSIDSPQSSQDRVSPNNELQNRVSDLESELQQHKNLVTNLQTELEQKQELQKQLETQRKLVRELQTKLQQQESVKKEPEKEKQPEKAKESLELTSKPKYSYILPNRPMIRLLDNPSAAQNLSDEEIGWFD